MLIELADVQVCKVGASQQSQQGGSMARSVAGLGVTIRVGALRRWALGLGVIFVFTQLGCKSAPVELVVSQAIGSGSSSTPVLGKNAIVFGSESGNVYYYGRDGRYLAKFQAIKEVVSAPAYDKASDTIVFGSTSYVFYATSGLGKKRWSVPTRDRIKGDPTISEGIVYFGSYDDHLYALDLKSSRRKWIFPTRDAPAMPGDSADADLGSESVDAKDDAEAVPEVSVGDFSYSKPFVLDGVVYVGNMDGYIYAIDAKNGHMKWRFETEGAVTSSPFVTDGVLYVGSNDNHLHAISLSDQKPIFKHKTGGWVNASPVVHEGTLYIGSDDGKFYALDPKSGAQKWAYDTGGEIKSRPAFMPGKVIITSGARQGGVYILNTSDGSEFYALKREGKIESDPTVEGNMIYLTTSDGMFLGLKVKGAK